MRIGLSMLRTGPLLVADELGYLTNARVLTGGMSAQLERAPFYRGGYSLLLAPIVGAVSDPHTAYRLVLVLNALLAASVLPLLYILLRRYTDLDERTALAIAAAGAIYPALTTLSQVAMSENALFPLVCVWLLACGALIDRSGARWAAAAGAATAALYAVHGRMVPAIALTIVLVVWLAARRGLRPGAIAAFVVALAIGLLGAQLLSHYLIDNNYGGHAVNEASDRFHSLLHPDALATAAANLSGQLWYVLVATFGLAAVALAWIRTRPVVLLGVALTVCLLVVSAGSFPERTRPDMLVYGRYVEVALPVLIAFGLAWLVDRPVGAWARRVGGGFAALTLLVVAVRVIADDPGLPNRWNISALPFVTRQLGAVTLIGAALIAVGGAIVLLLLSNARSRLLPIAAVALFLPVVAYSEHAPVLQGEHGVYAAGWQSPERALAGVDVVAYDLSRYDTTGLYATQWFMPHTRLVLFDATRQAPPSQYVMSARDWPSEHPDRPAVEVWRAPKLDQVLWRLGTA